MVRVRSHRSRNWVCALAALLLAFGLTGSALAQTDVTTSRISGTVEGTDKAPLPGVTVEATNKDTGLKIVDVTDANGFYRILNLPTGTYSISASLDGFVTATADSVRLLLGSAPTVNFTLQSDKISESITVTSEAPLVEVTNTTASTTIQQEQIENLPSFGRDYKQLVLLTPESRTDSERGNLSLSGERGINTSVTVDGMDYNNAFFGGSVGAAENRAPLSISQESIKEFSVVTNGASVEYGRSGGGFINIITKSGTNSLHGSGFYFDQPKSLISDFPAVGATPSRDPADQKKQQYGASLGGPIVRDKIFYFLSYDHQDQDITVPILSSNLNPAFFTTYPALASPPAYVQTQDGSVLFGRLDYQVNSEHRLMLRVNSVDYQGINGTSNSQSRTESYNGIEGLDSKAWVGSWSGQFGSNFLNDLNFNYIDEDTPREDKGLNLPEIQVGGLRFGEVSFLPIQTNNKRKAFADTLTYLYDRHVFKGGVDYNDTSVDQVFRGNWRGVFVFSANPNPNFPNQPNDFLAGRWSQYRQFGGLNGLTSEEAGRAAFHQKETAFFLQDQWFIRANLTLSAGVRLENLDNPNSPILNPSDPNGRGGLNLSAHIPDSKNQISPRLGISWAPDDKTAVRFSLGRYWSRTPALLWAQPFTSNGVRGAQLVISAPTANGNVTGAPTDPNAPGWGTGFNPVGVERVDFNRVTSISTPNVFTVDPNFENPYTDRVTLGAEREILPRISLGLDFTYAEGNQLQRLTDINRVYSGATSPVNGLPVYSATRRFPAYGAIITDLSDSESRYKSVTATLQRRYADSYSLYGAVTWSRDRDNDSNERNFSGIQAEDVNNLGLNWGPSNRDQEWKVILNGVWDTPWWGIGLSGAVQYYTGSPYTPIIGADVNNDTVNGTDRPTINGQHLGRNSERQPDLYTTSLRLSKKFTIGPTGLSLFAECFNCTDHTNKFVSANNQIWGTLQTPRVDPVTNRQTFGVVDSLFTTTGPFGPRTIQLGLRFEF